MRTVVNEKYSENSLKEDICALQLYILNNLSKLLSSQLISMSSFSVLNNESDLGGDKCAGEVLSALRDHGWVISSEEQDTHELFHVLTATIDDELVNVSMVPSLLDVSWVDLNCVNPVKNGVVLKTNSWELITLAASGNVQGEKYSIRNIVQMKCKAEDNLENDSFSNANSVLVAEDKGSESHVVVVNGTADHVSCDNTIVKNSPVDEDETSQSCDNKGCEDSAKTMDYIDNKEIQSSDKQTEDSSVMEKRAERINSEKLSSERTFDNNSACGLSTDVNLDKHEDCRAIEHKIAEYECAELIEDRVCSIDDSKKSRLAFVTTRKHGTESYTRKVRSDNHDSPFRGYLASQLQCVSCGHKVSCFYCCYCSIVLMWF